MNMRLSFSRALCLLVMGVILSPVHWDAQASPLPTPSVQTKYPANFPWRTQYVQQDPPRDLGQFASIASRPFDGYPVISYYDATNGDLLIAIPVLNQSGNCGTDNNWSCQLVDGGSGIDVGMYSSIDVWGNSAADWRVGIGYFDATNQSLKVALWKCMGPSCSMGTDTILIPANPGLKVGLYTSVKFDSAGNLGIAYFETTITSPVSKLSYAQQVPTGGNCGVGTALGQWDCKNILTLTGEGQFTSLDFSFDDIPYIAYYDALNTQLGLAYRITSSSCGSVPDWTCTIIDGAADDEGLYPSLVAPTITGDTYHVAYYDKTNRQLKYYTPVWGSVVVDEMGTNPGPMGISMAIDTDGLPVIAYQQAVSGFIPPALRVTRPYLAYRGINAGNCGDLPPGHSTSYWFCTTLDPASQGTSEAGYASITLNNNGLAMVAYTEYDSINKSNSLKISYQTFLRTYLPFTFK